jgi:hypothetical protein
MSFTDKEKHESSYERAYRLGQESRYEGRLVTANPYPKFGSLRTSWADGWNEVNDGLLDTIYSGED